MAAGQLVGFVGVGRMGGPMASRLLDAGYSLVVFDTNAEVIKPLSARGAKVAASAAEVASLAEVVFMSLPTPPIVQAVCLGETGILTGQTLKTLIDPTQRSSAIAGNPQATSIDQQIRSLTGSEALTQDFYALALDIFSELTVAAGGDITKLSEILDRGKTDPAGLVAMLSPQTQERLRQFSVKISDQRR